MVADSLARTVTRLVADGPADADLLRRFVATRDEAAFALIVRRHGPMVFGVCRRTLGHQQDAEDAFQAVFLVLARKADTVRPNGLSRWLYGVAVRVANKARVRRSGRALASAELSKIPAPPAPPPVDWLPLLDAALARLPDRDRNPVLLCDLLGRSRAEAAAELGIAEGTLSSRLARAREKLRARLARLGATLSLTTLAVGLAHQAAGTIPTSLLESTVAAGTSAAAARELADGVLRTMLLAKIFKLSALGACVIGLAAGAVIWLPGAGAGPTTGSQEAPKKSVPTKEETVVDSDFDRIQGAWVIESVKAPPGASTGRQGFQGTWENTVGNVMTFRGDAVQYAPFPGQLQFFHLTPTADPKSLDFTFRDLLAGPRGGRVSETDRRCIYKFDGDKLRIVIGDPDLGARPDSFEWGGPRSPFVHLVLRRPTDDERNELNHLELNRLDGKWTGLLVTEKGQERTAPTGLELVVKGDRLRLDLPDLKPLQATFTVDMSSNPWHIDVTATESGAGFEDGAKVRGIVARNGGYLRLALGASVRPASFEAATKEGTVYLFCKDRLTAAQALELWRPGTKPAPAETPKKEGPPANERIRQLQRERVKALEEQLQLLLERVKDGRSSLSDTLEVVRELAEAELDVADTREARIAAVEKMHKQLTTIEAQLIQLQETGLQTKSGVLQAKAARLKAEIELEKLKSGK
jgi:RNA polymerase sigma factor (sigma-70 family)